MQRFIPTLLLLMMYCVGVSAQKLKMTVTEFALDPLDTSASVGATARDDNSGYKYAIVKVTSTNPDDDLNAYTFNFGMLSHVSELHGEKLWLYVQKNAKKVTVKRDGYADLTFDLGMTLGAGRNYVMEIQAQERKVQYQMMEFKVSPQNVSAVVMVKSAMQGSQEEFFGQTDATGSIARNLPYGTYTYKIIDNKNLYKTTEGRFTLNDKSKTLTESVTLTPNFSTVTLKTVAGAEIYVNGEKKGTGSWSGELKAGSYDVECRMDKHRPAGQTVRIVENDNRTIELTAPVPITGTAALTSNPNGASVSIDGKDYGKTPQNINLIIGNHVVAFSMPNYRTEEKSFTVKEDDMTNVSATLSNYARMTINSNPSGATLYLDGENKGRTPFTGELASGDYTLRLTHSGYRDVKKQVHLDSSNPTQTFSMQRQYQKRYAFYVQPTFQVGSMMAVGGTLGGYIYNINVEASYLLGLGKSDPLYWNYIGTSSGERPKQEVFKASAVGGKVGYGIIIGNHLRVTPQLGYSVVMVSGDNSTKCNASNMSVTARVDYVLCNHLCVAIAPEYSFAISKSSTFTRVSDVLSKLNGWAGGFNLRMGVSLYF